jgi:hypothetical protein
MSNIQTDSAFRNQNRELVHKIKRMRRTLGEFKVEFISRFRKSFGKSFGCSGVCKSTSKHDQNWFSTLIGRVFDCDSVVGLSGKISGVSNKGPHDHKQSRVIWWRGLLTRCPPDVAAHCHWQWAHVSIFVWLLFRRFLFSGLNKHLNRFFMYSTRVSEMSCKQE